MWTWVVERNQYHLPKFDLADQTRVEDDGDFRRSSRGK
jgi:hypothetical protein